MKTLVKKDGLFPSLESKSINNFFDDFITKDLFDWTDRNFAALGSNLPSVNLKETDTKIEVELAAPGMKREDFKVEIDNDILMISSEKENEFNTSINYEEKIDNKFTQKINEVDYEGNFLQVKDSTKMISEYIYGLIIDNKSKVKIVNNSNNSNNSNTIDI